MPAPEHRRRARAPVEPTWEIPESQVDLRLDDVSRDTGVQETGPLPVVPPAAATTDAVKLVGGAGGILGLLALVDKLVQGSGLTADEIVKQLGPALGVLYTASPGRWATPEQRIPARSARSRVSSRRATGARARRRSGRGALEDIDAPAHVADLAAQLAEPGLMVAQALVGRGRVVLQRAAQRVNLGAQANEAGRHLADRRRERGR